MLAGTLVAGVTEAGGAATGVGVTAGTVAPGTSICPADSCVTRVGVPEIVDRMLTKLVVGTIIAGMVVGTVTGKLERLVVVMVEVSVIGIVFFDEADVTMVDVTFDKISRFCDQGCAACLLGQVVVVIVISMVVSDVVSVFIGVVLTVLGFVTESVWTVF